GLVAHGGYDAGRLLGAYRDWARSKPFDMGNATRQAFVDGHPDPGTEANGSLMRVAPIGVWAAHPAMAAEVASRDSALSHPNPVCRAACAAFAAAISAALGGADRGGMRDMALAHAGGVAAVEEAVRATQ